MHNVRLDARRLRRLARPLRHHGDRVEVVALADDEDNLKVAGLAVALVHVRESVLLPVVAGVVVAVELELDRKVGAPVGLELLEGALRLAARPRVVEVALHDQLVPANGMVPRAPLRAIVLARHVARPHGDVAEVPVVPRHARRHAVAAAAEQRHVAAVRVLDGAVGDPPGRAVVPAVVGPRALVAVRVGRVVQPDDARVGARGVVGLVDAVGHVDAVVAERDAVPAPLARGKVGRGVLVLFELDPAALAEGLVVERGVLQLERRVDARARQKEPGSSRRRGARSTPWRRPRR